MIFRDGVQSGAMSREVTGRSQICVTVPIANGPSGAGRENTGRIDPRTAAVITRKIAARLSSVGNLFGRTQPIARYTARIPATRYAGYICQRYPSVQKIAMPSATARDVSTFIHAVHVSFLENEATRTKSSIATKTISRILMVIDALK